MFSSEYLEPVKYLNEWVNLKSTIVKLSKLLNSFFLLKFI